MAMRKARLYRPAGMAGCITALISPPSAENYKPRDWQKPHLPNLTGSPAAYRPKGSILSGKHRPQVTGDYDAWTPGN